MEIDILIDELTDCLIDRTTGCAISTRYMLKAGSIRPKEYRGWKFNWSQTQRNGFYIYELFVEDSNVVQGRISLKVEGGVANVDIVETAPHNFGHNGKYKGVGGHLFAIACKVSLDGGCDGVVAFTSKSNLVEYYKRELHAVELFPRRMVIFEDAAQILLRKYIRK